VAPDRDTPTVIVDEVSYSLFPPLTGRRPESGDQMADTGGLLRVERDVSVAWTDFRPQRLDERHRRLDDLLGSGSSALAFARAF
jgi:hypothetical protein